MFSLFFHLIISGVCFLSSQNTQVYASENNVSIQTSPASKKLELKPGETFRGTFSVQNPGSREMNYSIEVFPYQVSDLYYNPDFSTNNSFTQIANWVKFDQTTGTVSAYGTVDVDYSVDVPNDAPGGGQYAVIVAKSKDFASSNPEDNLKVVGSVGTILYAHINGAIKKEGSLVSNKINFLSIGQPIMAETTIQNTGNIDFETTSTLKITRLLNNHVIYDSSESPLVNNILPNTSRTIFDIWEETPKIGLFKVSQTISFLDQSNTTEKIVFVCPVWLVVAICVIVTLILVLIITAIVPLIRRRTVNFSPIK